MNFFNLLLLKLRKPQLFTTVCVINCICITINIACGRYYLERAPFQVFLGCACRLTGVYASKGILLWPEESCSNKFGGFKYFFNILNLGRCGHCL